jgi:hypothetical protein
MQITNNKMKNLLTTVLFSFLFFSISFSQKSDFTLGVDFSQNNQNYNYGYDIYYPYGYYYGPTYNFQPRIGYFISDNIEIGLGYKSGKNDIERTYIAYNPSGLGENYNYSNTSNYSYVSYSPYVKYYINNMFISARYSINETKNMDDSNYPIWALDTNGVYMVSSFDNYQYNYSTKTKTTEISVGYKLSYNDKIFFEPSFSVRNETGEVVSENIITTNLQDPEITEITSPISDGNHFRVNLAVSIRLGK